MAIPSFNDEYADGQRGKPRIQVLEIRDRDHPDGEPIALLLVERQVTYRRDKPDGPVYEASIRLSYEQILPRHARHAGGDKEFCGGYSAAHNRVSLSSTSALPSAVFLDPPELRGQRIGTYLMNEIVMWAQRWPDAIVNSVSLSSGQASNEDSKNNRNTFWEQFGLVFDYSDPEHKEGRSRPMPVKELTPTDEWTKNITERYVLDYLADVLYAERQATADLRQRTKILDERSADIRKAEDSPIRWALKILYYKYAGIMAGGTALSIVGSVLWWHYRG